MGAFDLTLNFMKRLGISVLVLLWIRWRGKINRTGPFLLSKSYLFLFIDNHADFAESDIFSVDIEYDVVVWIEFQDIHDSRG